MMKRTLTAASPKVLPFTFRSPFCDASLQKTKFLLVFEDGTRATRLRLRSCQRQREPQPRTHPVVISLSQAGFLRGSEFQFSPTLSPSPFISSLLQRI